MNEVEKLGLLINHFDPDNVTDVLDIRNRVIPALEREQGIMYDLYRETKASGEDSDAFLENYRTIGRHIRTAKEKLSEVLA